MVNYRDRLGIIADILNVVSCEAGKTQIMYKANLSYTLLQRYLCEVLNASLVSFDAQKQHYLLTSKGEVFLALYKNYARLNKSVENRLSFVNEKRRSLEELCLDKSTSRYLNVR